MEKSKFYLVSERVKQQRHDDYILKEKKLIEEINAVFIDREFEILNWFADSKLSDITSITIDEYKLYSIIFGETNVPNDIYNIRSMKISKLLKMRFKSLGLVLIYSFDSIDNKTCHILTDKCAKRFRLFYIGLFIFIILPAVLFEYWVLH